jgi:hypothetical protein
MTVKASFGPRIAEFKASMICIKLPQSLIDIKTWQAFEKNFKAYLTFNSVTSL